MDLKGIWLSMNVAKIVFDKDQTVFLPSEFGLWIFLRYKFISIEVF